MRRRRERCDEDEMGAYDRGRGHGLPERQRSRHPRVTVRNGPALVERTPEAATTMGGS